MPPKSSRSIPTGPGLTPPTSVPDTSGYDERTAAATPADRAERVKEFVDSGPGLDAAGFCETVGHRVVFANSAGHRAAGRYTRATLDGIHQTGSSAGSGHATAPPASGRSMPAPSVSSQRGGLATPRRHSTRSPASIRWSWRPSVLATIAVFFAYYGFNAKNHAEGQSFVTLGEQQFDPVVSLVDDVDDPRAFGVGFDVEGTPRRRVELVAEGVSRSLAHDRRTAAAAGTESTGHAVPGSEVFGPFPSSVFVGEGDADVDELIGGVDRGLYVSTFNYCRILDPKTMVVTGLTRNGTFMIENGAITGPVSNLRFTQSFLEALGPGNVRGVGGDGRWADSEFGSGLVHAPSMALAAWHFTGGIDG